MTPWKLAQVSFKFQLSDWVIFMTHLPMQIRAESPMGSAAAEKTPQLPTEGRLPTSEGFCIRNLPLECEQPVLSSVNEYICYIPLQYQHCYIDLSWSFDQYSRKFSAKTRSSIQRKIRKYRDHCGERIDWKIYRRPEELSEFFHLATQVSKLTYQERLLGVGLPDSEEFKQEAVRLAQDDRLRSYVLFDGKRPVAYLYCPEKDGILTYAYLGYDPEYHSLSIGTVLQWLAIESIFQERRFRYFDFTEGQSSHKQLFASHQRLCANVLFVRKSILNMLLIHSHYSTNIFSKWIGDTLDRYGVKTRLKQILRRA